MTAVEFLPVQETQNDTNDVDPTGTDGRQLLGLLDARTTSRRIAATPRTRAPAGPTTEFQAMVKAFHDAGIKVFTDVVYNHTGEGGPWNSTDKTTYNLLSLRGLDNPTYYELTSDLQSPYDNTGVGGNFNTYNPVAQNLIVDSLAYWQDTLGVDGFRFDLAPVLGNTCRTGCFTLQQDRPEHRAEPDHRPDARRARPRGGDRHRLHRRALGHRRRHLPGGQLPQRLVGVERHLPRHAAPVARTSSASRTSRRASSRRASPARPTSTRTTAARPWNSINFMVAHDGFTLGDLYSCNGKNNNQAWPYGPSDGGTDNNNSWDQGGVAADQRQAARNGFAFLMLSAGTPMMTGGDEYLRVDQVQQQPVQPRLVGELAHDVLDHRPDATSTPSRSA